ncbi:hypothetical protein FO519_000406 [Halicephalobus sp. NKZ332]|nr:hypothetical protein FO519_000406 [Halicephalobus sp. NKZ332]
MFFSSYCDEKVDEKDEPKDVDDNDFKERSHVEGELSVEDLQQRRIEKLATLPYSHPPPDPHKARLVVYDYDIETTTVVHNPLQPEESGVNISTRAKYVFEILNHDENGCILGRYQVSECIYGPCENIPDMYFYIVQGGQNLLGVYYKSHEGSENEKPNWGLTMALVYGIASPAKGGEGDEQIVVDIVFIEADEQFIVQNPFQQEAAIRVHSHVSAEMMNRTRRYMNRYCPKGMLGSVCAQEIFGAKYLGKNWIEINKKLSEFSPSQITLKKFVAEETTKLEKCLKSEECPGLFKVLTDVLRQSDPEAVLKVIQEEKSDVVLDFLLDGIAAVGPIEIWQRIIHHFQSKKHAVSRFVQNLAFTTISPTVALKELKNWKLNEEVDLYNTIGYLTNRRCLSTSSHLNACINKKDSFFNFLLENKEKIMTTEQQSRGLWHLLFKSTAEYFSQFLCSQNDVTLQKRALTFYNKLHHSFFERSINMKLLKIFWNACPHQVPQSQSALALNVLVKIAPHYPTVGSFLLRSEKNNPENQNLWGLFYQKVHEAIENGNHDVRKYWNELRQLRVFKPNYLQRSLDHRSSSFIEKLENFSVPVTVKGALVANDDGSLEEFSFALSSDRPLFSIASGKDHETLTILGYPEVISSSKVGRSIVLRDFSRKIRLLSGLTLNLDMNVVGTLKLDTDEATFDLNSGLSIGVKASIVDYHQSYGTVESKTEIFTEAGLGNIDLCPVADIRNIVFKGHFSKKVNEKEEQKVFGEKNHGFLLNLGSNVNAQCN